ncbi:MAG: hypothetical protein IRZ09_09470 [Variibacter sp.]|nr:hypothetical protein [Variibacter sp.]
MQVGGAEIREVEIAFETVDGTECEFEYELKAQGEEKAKIETKSPDGHKEKRKSDEAVAEVKGMIERMNPRPGMTREDLIESACRALDLDRSTLRSLEVEVAFSNGEELKAKLH